MKLEKFNDEEELRNVISCCQEDEHVQQVAFSTYHDSLTQVCFNCGKVRTSIKLDN